ncbi:hypothetical protein CDL15_Pgr014166 [Punica granatum]|uniref:Uncharacterized protein n=1 Tax=Punica granatum TaxID=22663 RepID=A0A218XIP7_PUNGR|nr:hypothetical protein CDL15_Pgr014166 [Punica granatum]PKH47920.1 hypothetical protein CRG98_050401 [Punica granatum]
MEKPRRRSKRRRRSSTVDQSTDKTMSERDDLENPNGLTTQSSSSSSSSSSSFVLTLKILFQSIAILLRHRLHFLSIYALTALPIFLRLFSFAVSVHPVSLCRERNQNRTMVRALQLSSLLYNRVVGNMSYVDGIRL